MKDGVANLGVISDFDHTLTTYRVNGTPGPSTFKVLELSGFFGTEFQALSAELSDHYKPIEYDPSLSHEEKYRHMDTWWTKTFQNYAAQGVKQSMLQEMLLRSNIKFRHGIDKVLSRCREYQVPFTIVSAGLGNIVDLMLRESVEAHDVHLISNFMLFDAEGQLTGFSEPMIHSLSKSAALRQHLIPKNLIVLGDMPTDTEVVKEVEFEEVIYIGYANDQSKGSLDAYTSRFDLIILNDGNLDVVEELVLSVAGIERQDHHISPITDLLQNDPLPSSY